MSHDDDEALGVKTRLAYAWNAMLLAAHSRQAHEKHKELLAQSEVEHIDLMQQAETRRIARAVARAREFYGENRTAVGIVGAIFALFTLAGLRRWLRRNKS